MVWITKDEAHEFASVDDLVRMTGCGVSTARRWKAQPDTMPESARRIIGYHFCHDLSIIWGKDWAHFRFVDGELFAPGWRNGFDPYAIQAMFFRVQQVRCLESSVRQLQKDLARVQEQCEALERANYFYRAQVNREARFGLMLERIVG